MFTTIQLTVFLIGMPGTQELILIAVVVLFLFGGKKIPELMKGLGKGVSEFKRGMKDLDPNNDNELKS